MIRRIAVSVALVMTSAAVASAQTDYKKDLPDSLVKAAKISEDVAARTALARVPKGEIRSVELERENGKLIYSYDIKVPGKSGIQEVNVNAVSGKVVHVGHESSADEQRETAAEAKAAKKAKPPKKP